MLTALRAATCVLLLSQALLSFAKSGISFAITVPAPACKGPITGRVFVVLSRKKKQSLLDDIGSWQLQTPFFARDIHALAPGQSAIIGRTAIGYPVSRLSAMPAGDYYVQALVNVYTEFHRADGHTIWAHMDQWEGQQFNLSPGNLYSEVQKVHLDPATGYDVRLSLTKVIPAVKVPVDTPWLKHIKIQSEMLTKFWGHPIFLGAVVLLPRGYEEHPEVSYPTIYQHTHFHLSPPLDFSTDGREVSEAFREQLNDVNKESGYELYQSWNGEKFPRVIVVTLQHPTPYFDDSYAVNSANNGPYGDAIVKELIPFLESHFRMIAKPYARLLTGGSTGGWESLASQIFYP